MTTSLKNLQGLLISIVVLILLMMAAYFVAPTIKDPAESLLDTAPATVQLRFLFAVVGGLLALGVGYATRENEAWIVTSRQVVLMIVGALLYGVFSWLFNGVTFAMPAISQVSLRPAIVFPAFFGYMFGPVVGLVAGAAGNLIGDLFIGTVSPHWSMANGLIGLAAGLAMMLEEESQEQLLNVGMGIALAGGVAATAIYFTQPNAQFAPPPEGIRISMSLFMGVSVLVGGIMVAALRFVFPNRPGWAVAALWGGVGVIIALALAALADVWVNGYLWTEAILGEFIPAAGPNLIALAILIPLLMIAYHSVQEMEE
jgi:hypothetical protein